jgi:hypothetical protein
VGGFVQLLPAKPSGACFQISPTGSWWILQMQPVVGPEVSHPSTAVDGIKDFCSLTFIGWN